VYDVNSAVLLGDFKSFIGLFCRLPDGGAQKGVCVGGVVIGAGLPGADRDRMNPLQIQREHQTGHDVTTYPGLFLI